MLDNRRIGQDRAVCAAGQHRGQIETKSVHVQVQHPVAQTVENEVAHDRMVAVHGVAAAGIIVVMRGFLVHDVENRIIYAAE